MKLLLFFDNMCFFAALFVLVSTNIQLASKLSFHDNIKYLKNHF